MKTYKDIELTVTDNDEERFERLHRVIGYILAKQKGVGALIKLEDHKGDLVCTWNHFDPRPSQIHTISQAWETVGSEPYDNVNHITENPYGPPPSNNQA